jgi:histidinol-phosphatase (PHP family)
MHANFSTDSKMRIEEVLAKSKELNIGCIITEHIDFNFPRPGEFIFDFGEYFNAYNKYRGDKLLLGVELGMKDDCILENKEAAANQPFDYVIGSIHMVNNTDLYYEAIYKGRSKNEVYAEYFDCMLRNIKNHTFVDCLGHIDYIARYARYEDKELYYREYSAVIDEILKEIISSGVILELNTRRLADKSAVINLIDIYKRYRELGGLTVTVGSDAHNMQDIGKNLNTALELAKVCDLKPVYFKNRKAEYM